MTQIDIEFTFLRGIETYIDTVSFEVSRFIEQEIDDRYDLILDTLNRGTGGWDSDGWMVTEWDNEWGDPNDFSTLDEYGKYIEKCERYGEGYRLRYADIGEFDFDEESQGCWDSDEDFAREYFEDCYDIPNFLTGYIDWDSVTHDLMMDYSSYAGSNGKVHIFQN